MKTPRRIPILPVLLPLLLVACASPASDASGADPTQQVAAAAPHAEGNALRLERAERSVDVGRDLPAATASLQSVLADPSATTEQRDQARLAMSRAAEASGDTEGAVRAVEDLLADHPSPGSFPLEDAARARLRKLLTGTDAESTSLGGSGAVAPLARALSKYFTREGTKAPINVEVVVFGGDHELNERLGTFAISGAINEVRRESSPLDDDRLSVSSHSSGVGSWVEIPRERAHLASALVVTYFDLDSNRVPARYDAYLPIPSAEIVARLQSGDGFVMARERPNAPPLLVIAAPRAAQFADVEEAAAALTSVPTDPVVVALKRGLRPEEIKTVVRGSFPAIRACYEALLTTQAAAKGSARLHFTIYGNGSVDAVSVDTDGDLTHASSFQACLTQVTRALSFPATQMEQPTTVVYPVVFSPGGD